MAMSSQYESAFARMQGLAGVTAGEVDGLKKSVLDLAGRTGQAPLALADALYQASSSGLNTAQALDAVNIAAKAAASGMGSAADITGLVASATAAYGAANITAAHAADVLTAAIREGRADPEELAGSLGRLLPIANAAGISFDEVGGATAYLSNIMGNTMRTVTSLQGVLVKLMSPTQQGRQALIDMGTSVEDLHAAISQHGLMGALDLLREKGFLGNAQAMTQLFDDIEGRQGAIALLRDESGSLASTLDKVTNSAGSLDRAFGIASETSGFKMKQAWAQIKVALIEAGDAIMPIVSGVAGAIGTLARSFESLSPEVKTIVIAFLGLAAAAGPLLVISGTLIKNFALVKGAMAAAGLSASTASVALGAVGIALIAATHAYSEHARIKAHLVATTNELADAMNREASGEEAATRTQIGSMLANKQLLDTAAKHNLNVNLLADVIQGKAVPAFEALKGSMGGPTDATTQLVIQVLELRKAYMGAVDKTDAAAKVQEEMGRSTAATDKIVRAFGVGLTDTTKAIVDTSMSADELAAAQQRQADKTKKATDAIDAHIKALESDLQAQHDLVDFAHSAADAQFALADATRDYARGLEELPGKLKEIAKSKDSANEKDRKTQELYQGIAEDAERLANATVDAFDKASNGAATATEKGDLFRRSMLESALAADGPAREAILNLGLAIEKVPDEKKTAIIAAVEAGDLETAIALLNGASATRTAEMKVDVDDGSLAAANAAKAKLENPINVVLNFKPGSGWLMLQGLSNIQKTFTLPGLPGAAGGTFVDHPMISALGEGGRREVVLPLENESRMREFMHNPQVVGPILKALGMVHSAAGRVVNMTHTTTPAAAIAATTVVTSQDATQAARDAAAEQDKVMERMYNRDALSYEDYRDYFDKRREGLALYSDEEQALFDKSQQLDQDRIRARKDEERTILDTQDRMMRYELDNQNISYETYQAYLDKRRGAYQVFSVEWISLSNEMLDIEGRINQGAHDFISAMFDQAAAVKALADAQQANAEASAAYDKAVKPEDRAAAAVALADAAEKLHDAQATSQGLSAGTPEWAAFMREQLTADSVWNSANGRTAIADAIDRLLLAIPTSFASGGYAPATPGGLLARVADAGQGEYMIPADKMHSVMAGGGGGHMTFNLNLTATSPLYDKARAGSDLMALINQRLISAGHKPLGSR